MNQAAAGNRVQVPIQAGQCRVRPVVEAMGVAATAAALIPVDRCPVRPVAADTMAGPPAADHAEAIQEADRVAAHLTAATITTK